MNCEVSAMKASQFGSDTSVSPTGPKVSSLSPFFHTSANVNAEKKEVLEFL